MLLQNYSRRFRTSFPWAMKTFLGTLKKPVLDPRPPLPLCKRDLLVCTTFGSTGHAKLHSIHLLSMHLQYLSSCQNRQQARKEVLGIAQETMIQKKHTFKWSYKNRRKSLISYYYLSLQLLPMPTANEFHIQYLKS